MSGTGDHAQNGGCGPVRSSGIDARLPDFVVVGAQKAGTTSLRAALAQHPGVHCARETHFFCDRFGNGVEWYSETLRAEAPAGPLRLLGEKCPHYLSHPDAIGRMAATVPEAKLVVVLRDPVARAYSHYWHQRRRMREQLPFDDALDAEADRTTGGDDEFAYVGRGRYLAQLERIRGAYPADALHVMFFEDLVRDPAGELAALGAFLGVDGLRPAADEAAAKANPYREYRPRWLFDAMFRHRLWRRLPKRMAQALWRAMEREVDYLPLSESQRRRLQGTFAADNRALAAWLGRDLPWSGT